jgi:hypothetical protein
MIIMTAATRRSRAEVPVTRSEDFNRPKLTTALLSTAPIEKLVRDLDSAPHERYHTARDQFASYESILSEVIRRGGGEAEKLLAAKLAAQDAKLAAALDAFHTEKDETNRRKQWQAVCELERNVELVTALRRVQKKPDPLAVIVDRSERIEGGTRDLPTLKVALKNVDLEKREIGINKGADYRSGRHARCRIHVWDSDGKLLPHLPRLSPQGGGLSDEGPLQFGETWEVELALASYVKISSAGKYEAQVLYADSGIIADIDTPGVLDRMIVFRSETFELHVEHGPKIAIRLKQDEMETAKALIRRLKGDEPLRILIGDYVDKHHDFISPDSPQGALLNMAWQAVPALIEALEDENLTFRTRAWLISLLFSITLEHELDPTAEDGNFMPRWRGVLPDYETRGSIVTTVRTQRGYSQEWRGDGKRIGGNEDTDRQRTFAKKWLRFRDEYIDMEIEK